MVRRERRNNRHVEVSILKTPGQHFSALCLLVMCIPIVHADDSVDPAVEEAAIREARILQTEALAAQDLDTVERYWTPDATFRRALGQPVRSAAEARELLEAAASAGVVAQFISPAISHFISRQHGRAFPH